MKLETINIKPTLAVALRQAYLLKGSVARISPVFAWVAIDMILWGFMTKYLNTVAAPGFNFVPALLGAVLLWDFFGRVMHGITTAFLEDVWSRNFLNLFASPLSIPEYLGGLVLTSIATSTVGLIAMLLLATTIFGLSFFSYGVAIFAFLLVLFLFGIAFGILGITIVLRFGPASEWFIWPLPALLSPFAAVFYPLSILPAWLRPISYLLPPSYVFEGIRTILKGGAISWLALFGSATLAVVYIIGACWCFTHIYRYAVRTGLISRYTSEGGN